MIITIDGPAGAGKSTAARRLAEVLGFQFLDTGAMYRAVTWVVLQRQVNPRDSQEVAKIAREIKIEFRSDRVFVDDVDVTLEIRSPAINANISAIADNLDVRREMVDQQRRIASEGNYVCEGRDQGTVAFPDSPCKIFLTASPEARAQRRLTELTSRGESVDYYDILDQQNDRDRRDSQRSIGSLRQAPDAIVVLTDNLSLDQVVAELKRIVESRIASQLK